VAERVVDLLEVVEVEQRHPDPLVPPARAGECLPKTILEQQAVRQSRQLVVVREPVHTLLSCHPVRHVLNQQQGCLGTASLAGHNRGVDPAMPHLAGPCPTAHRRGRVEPAPQQVAAE
jgi:hypothetical protein